MRDACRQGPVVQGELDVLEQTNFDMGTVIGKRYVVQGKIGHGGMGSVFLALDLETGKQVAVKMIHVKYADNKAAVARFIREVAAVRSLDHPGIIKIFDSGQMDKVLYYVMEYVEGKSVRLLLQRHQRLAFPSVVRILCLAADALSHAHTITIHRDLSPENVMVLQDGSIRLLDFGLAKLEDQFKDLTITGVNLGKLQYASPEQQRNASKVDARADLYSLGVMFFEMLTGRAPLQEKRLTEYCPELPAEVDAFVEKALAPDPDMRFQTAVEFRNALLALYKKSVNPSCGKQG